MVPAKTSAPSGEAQEHGQPDGQLDRGQQPDAPAQAHEHGAVEQAAGAQAEQVGAQQVGEAVGEVGEEGQVACPDALAGQPHQAEEEGHGRQQVGVRAFRAGHGLRLRLRGRGGCGAAAGALEVGHRQRRRDGQVDARRHAVGGADAQRLQHPVSGGEAAERAAERVEAVEHAHPAADGARRLRAEARQQRQRGPHQQRGHEQNGKGKDEAQGVGCDGGVSGDLGRPLGGAQQQSQRDGYGQCAEADAGLDAGEPEQAARRAVRQSPAQQPAEPQAGHVGAEHHADGVGAVAEDGHELPRPEQLQDEGRPAGQEEGGVDHGEQARRHVLRRRSARAARRRQSRCRAHKRSRCRNARGPWERRSV